MTLSYYRSYGLLIESQIELPFLPPVPAPSAAPDIRILWGEEADLPPPERHGWRCEAGLFTLDIAGVARFEVSGGELIRIDRCAGTERADLVNYANSSAFAALLQQRGLLPIHASSVATDRGALLVMGRSGAGKSSTLAALVALGFPMIADDVSALILAEGEVRVQPAYPAVRLWADTLAALGHDGSDMARVRPEMDKYYLPQADFHDRPLRVEAVVLLDVHNDGEIALTPMEASQAYGHLCRFTFRRRFLQAQQLHALQFERAMALAGQARALHLRRPVMPLDPGAVAARIAGHFALSPGEVG